MRDLFYAEALNANFACSSSEFMGTSEPASWTGVYTALARAKFLNVPGTSAAAGCTHGRGHV